MKTYHLRPSGEVIDIMNRRSSVHHRRAVARGHMRYRRIVVWIAAILLLGLAAALGLSFGASLRSQSSLLQEKSSELQTVLGEDAKRQMDLRRMAEDPSFLRLFQFFRGALEDAEMYRDVLEVLFKLNKAETVRAGKVLRELRPLYAEIAKYGDRVETGDMDEVLFNGLKALMQTAFGETVMRICGKPSTDCYQWIKPYVEPPSLPQRSVKPDVEV